MTNIQREVTNFIEQDVSLRRGLTRGLMNTRALAKYVHNNLHLSCGLDAVISAIRRYDATEEKKEDIKERYKLLARAKISSRSRMISVLFKKESHVRKSLVKLFDQIDFSKGEVLRILEVTRFIKIVIDETNIEKVEKLFSKSDIVEVDENLGEISIIYDDVVIDAPGVFAALSSEISLNGISIRDGVICGSEHILVIKEDDLMTALKALNGVRKWGEKVK